MTFPKTKKEIVEMWRARANHFEQLLEQGADGMNRADLKARISTLRECATDLEYQTERAAKQKADAELPLDSRFRGGK